MHTLHTYSHVSVAVFILLDTVTVLYVLSLYSCMLSHLTIVCLPMCKVYFVCFSCAGGELFHECVIEESFKEKDVVHLMVQILEGLIFLHENNIVHLDLKVIDLCKIMFDFHMLRSYFSFTEFISIYRFLI